MKHLLHIEHIDIVECDLKIMIKFSANIILIDIHYT